MLAGRCLNDVSRLMAMSSEYDHTATFRQLTAHANSNRVTLFPIEALGITTPTSSNIEIGPRQMAWTGERGSSSDTAGPASIPPTRGESWTYRIDSRSDDGGEPTGIADLHERPNRRSRGAERQ